MLQGAQFSMIGLQGSHIFNRIFKILKNGRFMGRNGSFFSVFSINGQNAFFFKAWKAMRNWIIGNFVTGNSNIQLELQNIENLGQYRLENRLFWVSGGIPVTSGNL